MGIVVPPDRSPETDPDREEAERELEAYHPRPWWPSLMIRSYSSSTSSRATGELISYNLELTRVPPPSIVAVVCFRRDQAGPNQANRVECDGGSYDDDHARGHDAALCQVPKRQQPAAADGRRVSLADRPGRGAILLGAAARQQRAATPVPGPGRATFRAATGPPAQARPGDGVRAGGGIRTDAGAARAGRSAALSKASRQVRLHRYGSECDCIGRSRPARLSHCGAGRRHAWAASSVLRNRPGASGKRRKCRSTGGISVEGSA